MKIQTSEKPTAKHLSCFNTSSTLKQMFQNMPRKHMSKTHSLSLNCGL